RVVDPLITAGELRRTAPSGRLSSLLFDKQYLIAAKKDAEESIVSLISPPKYSNLTSSKILNQQPDPEGSVSPSP
ncbi:hypothetical protein Q8X25_34415, partial [Pseudomonas aeruginosa]|uniref:hypothetical protein n=1 Tax=Pseudomonas aeruginosa TaxID=287 RepID=UPI002905031A